MARDVGMVLARGLRGAAQIAGCPVDVVASDWRSWASVTFAGARHRLSLAAPASAALDHWLGTLAEQDFNLPGHLVADLNLVAVRRGGALVEADLEILTVEAD